jgi:hypothetical protein
MAKQESLLKVRGKIGDLSFTKHRSRGYEVRMKGGVAKERIMTDPNFQRTRENMSEFGSAAAKAKQLRQQLNNLSRNVEDRTMRNRLTSLVHRIQKADTESARGARVFKDENSGLLKGFEFNSNSSLKMLFAQELSPAYDRATGEVSLEIEPFDPLKHVLLLSGATHLQFTLAAAWLSDQEVLQRPVVQQSDYIPLIGEYAGTSLQVAVEPNLENVLYIMLGISMFQQTNDGYYPLHNRTYNAMTIVAVDIP